MDVNECSRSAQYSVTLTFTEYDVSFYESDRAFLIYGERLKFGDIVDWVNNNTVYRATLSARFNYQSAKHLVSISQQSSAYLIC